ncbi:MAG: hypothetical protein JW940_33910 [Polyangiaceae bacterium]|nr:hypothetical protein [Polyangiaceae bacterium]
MNRMDRRISQGIAFVALVSLGSLAACGDGGEYDRNALTIGGSQETASDGQASPDTVTSLSQSLSAASIDIEIATASARVNAGATGYALATCPTNSVVVGGGFGASLTLDIHMSRKYGNGWRIDAYNNGTAQYVTSYAYCLTGTSGTTAESTRIESVAAGASKCVSVSCPSGTVLTGGGFNHSADLMHVYANSANVASTGWIACGTNTTSGPVNLRARATCLSGVAASSYRKSTSSYIAATSYGTNAIPCNEGSLVTSGGLGAGQPLQWYIGKIESAAGTDRWRVYAYNPASSRQLLDVRVQCLTLD